MSDALRAVEKHLADLAADVVPRKELPSSFHWGLLQTMATALRSAEGMDQTARDLSRACAQNQETIAELRKENERLNDAMYYLATNIFERKWDGTIGRPEAWYMAGPFRHELAKWRGPYLVDAIIAAAKASK